MSHTDNEILFKELFASHYNRVVFYAQSYLHDQEKARGVAQEVFITVWQHISNSQEITPSFLFVIAKNKCLNILKKDQYIVAHKKYETSRQIDNQLDYISLVNSNVSNIYHKEVSSILNKALDKLPKKTSEAFSLSRNNNLSYREIAEIQGVSIKNIEYRISATLRFLRKELIDYFPACLGWWVLCLFF